MTTPLFLTLAQASTAPGPGAALFQAVPFIAIGVIFYFLIIRPQNQRQKALVKTIESLKTGDKVVTTGGIYGIISNVKEGKILVLKIADNVKIEIDKSAIASVVDRGSDAVPV